MADKRIQKTKEKIRRALIEMLQEQAFDDITVSALCRHGHTTRMTFYTYYSDKQSLVEDMMNEYYKEVSINYCNLQQVNNEENDAMIGYYNVLEAILKLFDDNSDFFKHASPDLNPYLYSVFYRYIFKGITEYIEKHSYAMMPVYPSRVMASLLCSGVWSAIQECYAEKLKHDELRKIVRTIYKEILKSKLFICR